MYAGTSIARVRTLAKGAPKNPELRRALPQRHSQIESESSYTPLQYAQFAKELKHHPDKSWTSDLLQSIQHGVTLGYEGPRGPMEARNLLSAHTHPTVIDDELQKECQAGRILGPFLARPLCNLKCSGVGVVPKKNGKWRMIHHLSAPHGSSVNDHIPKDSYSLQYASVDDAVHLLSSLGPGARMAKVDLKSAFRIIPVRKEDWELLGIRWRSRYYVDTCLPFGLRSAPYLFNQFADALEWILRSNYGLKWVIHYLDDYLILGPPNSDLCRQFLQDFLSVCSVLGIPVAMEKVEGPLTILTFLGLELDSGMQQIRLTQGRLIEILAELRTWQARKKATKRELLSLIGKLAFAARAVPAGRLFLRRLIHLSTKVRLLHHHIRLNREARLDIAWWQSFLPSWNGKTFFLEQKTTAAPDLSLYTDASSTYGCGGYFQGAWFHYSWQPHQQLSNATSIQWQELFAIVAATLTWGDLWSRKRIRFYCDNQAIVKAWEGQSSKHPKLMSLMRLLFLTAARSNFTVTLKHIAGKSNELADALSRKQFNRFFTLAPQANHFPTPTPGILRQL